MIGCYTMKLLLIFSLATLALSAPSVLDEDWQQWKQKHGIKYVNKEEESIRRAVWFRAFKHIVEHNEAGIHSYSLGLNKFSDMVGVIVGFCYNYSDVQ